MINSKLTFITLAVLIILVKADKSKYILNYIYFVHLQKLESGS